MTRIARVSRGPRFCSGKFKILAAGATLVCLGLFGIVPSMRGQGLGQNPDPLLQDPLTSVQQSHVPQINPPHFPKPNQKQKQAIADIKYEQMKKHAKNLTELVSSLQKEIEKSNPNVLSLEIAKKAKEVQKLAKKIEKEAEGN